MHVSKLSLSLAVLSAALTCGCSSKADSSLHVYQMGEKAALGPLLFTIFETQWLPQIGAMPDQKIPQNRYFLIRVSIVNGGGKDAIIPALSVEDDSGTSYPEITTDLGAPQWIGALRQIHPADSLAGNMIFDCPPGHYKLRLQDEDGEKAAFVDIPLSFTSEMPDVPIGGQAKPSPTDLIKK